MPTAEKSCRKIVSEKLIDEALKNECLQNAKYVKGIEPELFVPS